MFAMIERFSRRDFARTGAAATLAALLPQGVFGDSAAKKKAVIHADS